MSVDSALNFVPGERQDDFARMLPPAHAKGLLTGRVEKLPNLAVDLPGLPGLLAKMQMEGVLPEELRTKARSPRLKPSDRTPEEARALREKANAQIEFLKRSKNRPQQTAASTSAAMGGTAS